MFRTLAWLSVVRWFVDRQHLVSTVVTNVPGSEVIPVSPITGNVTVAFAVLSYAGTLVITVMVDPQCCPDLPALLAGLRSELDLLATDRTPDLAPQATNHT